MEGGEGNDYYYVHTSSDTVTEEASQGTDTVFSLVTLTTPNNVENLTLYGSNDIDGVGNDLANTMRGNSKNNELSGRDGTDTLYGNNGDDTLNGGNNNDELYGGAGDDTLKWW